jgi:hypothetical protein
MHFLISVPRAGGNAVSFGAVPPYICTASMPRRISWLNDDSSCSAST